MEIKALIIDNDTENIELIKCHLTSFEFIEIIDVFDTPFQELELIKSRSIDIIFLEIGLPNINGLDFIRNLQTEAKFIITTKFREFALDSYDVEVLDYLVKPISFNRFLKSINKIVRHSYILKKSIILKDIKHAPYKFIKVDKKLIKINLNDVLYIESFNDFIKINTKEQRFLVHKGLTSFTEELPKNNFVRVHRSFTIAIDKVKSVEGNLVEIESKRIPIGRKYLKIAKSTILNGSVIK
ncbi:LytR/AlgR family response regulator transcription factor [Tenacibaculum xiamenense]|uniref:LytR/AlgR family response regulator transcription factor n=1 Tax=Tenacibaculum xiamenense TaxID=1261553 RepID=UPI0038960175